jgi:hypothetical protein
MSKAQLLATTAPDPSHITSHVGVTGAGIGGGLLADFQTVEAFAAACNRTTRAVYRWLEGPDALPHVKFAGKTYIHVPSVRQHLLDRMKQPSRRRRRR